MKKKILVISGGISKERIIISTDKRGLKYIDKDEYQFEIIDTPKLDNIFAIQNLLLAPVPGKD